MGLAGFHGQGYAVATTDMGTGPTASVGDGNPEVWKDFGFRATHLMTVVAKQVILANYGQEPELSYFMGASTGGQQALQEAQRYPEDYDGIVAGVPAHCRTPLHAYFLWNYQILHKCPFTPSQEKNVIAVLATRMEGKLLAKPLHNIKRISAEKEGESSLDTIKKLFELPV